MDGGGKSHTGQLRVVEGPKVFFITGWLLLQAPGFAVRTFFISQHTNFSLTMITENHSRDSALVLLTHAHERAHLN